MDTSFFLLKAPFSLRGDGGDLIHSYCRRWYPVGARAGRPAPAVHSEVEGLTATLVASRSDSGKCLRSPLFYEVGPSSCRLHLYTAAIALVDADWLIQISVDTNVC